MQAQTHTHTHFLILSVSLTEYMTVNSFFFVFSSFALIVFVLGSTASVEEKFQRKFIVINRRFLQKKKENKSKERHETSLKIIIAFLVSVFFPFW